MNAAANMAKTIEIQTPSWLERHPVQIRRLLVRLVFSLGAQNGWQIVMHGQHWGDTDGDMASYRHTHDRELTYDEWRMILNHPAA